jgi:hypothetical protein
MTHETKNEVMIARYVLHEMCSTNSSVSISCTAKSGMLTKNACQRPLGFVSSVTSKTGKRILSIRLLGIGCSVGLSADAIVLIIRTPVNRKKDAPESPGR